MTELKNRVFPSHIEKKKISTFFIRKEKKIHRDATELDSKWLLVRLFQSFFCHINIVTGKQNVAIYAKKLFCASWHKHLLSQSRQQIKMQNRFFFLLSYEMNVRIWNSLVFAKMVFWCCPFFWFICSGHAILISIDIGYFFSSSTFFYLYSIYRNENVN